MTLHGKRYQEALKLVDRDRHYTPVELDLLQVEKVH